MNIVNEAINQSRSTGGMVNIQGWVYDLVLERLERMGFKMYESGHDGQWEASFHRHPQSQDGEFKVATNRLSGPFTVIQFIPSSKESSN